MKRCCLREQKKECKGEKRVGFREDFSRRDGFAHEKWKRCFGANELVMGEEGWRNQTELDIRRVLIGRLYFRFLSTCVCVVIVAFVCLSEECHRFFSCTRIHPWLISPILTNIPLFLFLLLLAVQRAADYSVAGQRWHQPADGPVRRRL